MSVENLTPTPTTKTTSFEQALALVGALDAQATDTLRSIRAFVDDAKAEAADAEARQKAAEAALADLDAKIAEKQPVEADLAAKQSELATVEASLAEFRSKVGALLKG